MCVKSTIILFKLISYHQTQKRRTTRQGRQPFAGAFSTDEIQLCVTSGCRSCQVVLRFVRLERLTLF